MRVKLRGFARLGAIGTVSALLDTNRDKLFRCSEKPQEGWIMKSMFAQAATFVLSTAGALAILVGAIDQPQVAASATGVHAGPLVAAVMSPAVSALA
ncbi:MAG: hypothetical protein JHD35_16915 [Sphingopyxis sp.]|nr:hypothetical protein [Sphingopyxis sp.]